MSGGPATINVKPLRDRYYYLTQQRGYTAADIASWLGWYRVWGKSNQPDAQRLMKRLGVVKGYDGKSRSMLRQSVITEAKALEIAEALGLDPVDIGL
jgi:hypothetical protein